MADRPRRALTRRCLAAWLLLAAGPALGGEACKVAVDIGHSRQVPGAISARGAPEWQFNAALASTLVSALSTAGIDALTIDPSGADMPLRERARAAKDAGASLLLSVHHDSVQPRYLSSWTWEGREHRYSDRFRGHGLFVSMRNARADESVAVATAIGEALRASGLRPSLHHAEPIAGEGRTLVDRERGIYRFDELALLSEAPMAAVLIEAGVIVHRDEELELATPAFRDKLAQAVLVAVRAHCERLRERPRR